MYIPNSDIIKKHFINFTIDDQLRESFEISIFHSNSVKEVIDMILETVSSFNSILKSKKPAVSIKNFDNGTVQLTVSYWYSLRGTRSRDGKLKTDIMLAILEKMKENNIGFPDHVQDIKLAEKNS